MIIDTWPKTPSEFRSRFGAPVRRVAVLAGVSRNAIYMSLKDPASFPLLRDKLIAITAAKPAPRKSPRKK